MSIYNNDTELLYPERVTIELRDLREGEWRELVDKVTAGDADYNDRLAFVLMMVRLNGCTSCNADSFRAMRGCTQCAIQTIRRHKGKDTTLIKLFDKARNEVEKFLEKDAKKENK